MTRYGNCIKKFQTGIPREIHPDFCSPKIFAKFKGTTQSCWLLLQKYTLNPWWFICAWLNFWVLCLFFFFFFFFKLWKTQWMKYFWVFKFISGFTSNFWAALCVLRNYNASEVPAGEASDRKKSPQAATKMHNGFDFKRHQYSSAFLSKRPPYT